VKSNWLTKPALLLSVMLATILIGCATVRPTVATKPAACTAFPRLTYSRLHDTDETIIQIKAYNARRDALCGPGL